MIAGGEGEEEIAGVVVGGIEILIEEIQYTKDHHVEGEIIEIMVHRLEENSILTFLQGVADVTKDEDHHHHDLDHLQDQNPYQDLQYGDAVGQFQNLGHHHLVDGGLDRRTGAVVGEVAEDAREVQQEDLVVDLLHLRSPAPHLESEEGIHPNL